MHSVELDAYAYNAGHKANDFIFASFFDTTGYIPERRGLCLIGFCRYT